MPPPIERQRRPDQSKETPSSKTERGVAQIESKIDYYRKNIVQDRQRLDVDGYDKNTWNVDRVMKYENYLFIASRDGRIAGFQIVSSDQNGDSIAKLDMTKFPQIVSVLKEKFGIAPTPPIQRAEQARRTEVAKRPEAKLDGSVESVLAVLQQVSVESNGEKLPISFPTSQQLSHYLRTNGVPSARYAQYVSNIRDHASLLTTAFRTSQFRGNITFDGQHFIATGGGITYMTTATRVLKMGQNTPFTTLSGERISITENATTTRYSVGGRTELHRRDGGIAMMQEGSSINFYDGRNDKALIEKRGTDVRINGPYGSVGMRPSGDAASYGREIAKNLRTPEAIGAYISQFYHGQDFKTAPEHHAWMQNIQAPSGNPVRYIGDGATNTIQDWKTTLTRGAGDCEDFALLAEGLLRQAGVNSFAMMVDPGHFETVYFEQAGDGQFYVCTVGLKGFSRSTTSFSSLGAAVRTLWQGGGSGAQFALNQPAVRAQFGSSYPAQSPGVFTLMQPGSQQGNSDMIEYSDEEYFRQFIRR